MRYSISSRFKAILMVSIAFFIFIINYADGGIYVVRDAPPFNIALKEQKMLYPLIQAYIPRNIKANYFFKGRLVNQVQDGYEVLVRIKKLQGNNTLIDGFRYNDGGSRSAVILDGHKAILILAIRASIFSFTKNHNFNEQHIIVIFYKNKKKLNLVNTITKPLLYGLKKSDYKFVFHDISKCPAGISVHITSCHR